MNRLPRLLIAATTCTLACASVGNAQDSTDPLMETLTVTASLREASEMETAASVSVMDEALIKEAGQQHFESLSQLVPNLNWAGGTSRPRYFQIRGIGERSQYEGAPNPSVGFLVDDIDFSGMGGVATLFDTRQIEVLRGPQGTVNGANALAGLISVRTVDPGDSPEFIAETTLGSDATVGAGLAFGGPLGEDLSYRVVALRELAGEVHRHAGGP